MSVKKSEEKSKNNSIRFECGTNEESLCSRLFVRYYDGTEKIKQIILSFVNDAYSTYEIIFEQWPKDKTKKNIEGTFLNEKSIEFSRHIFSLLKDNEERAKENEIRFGIPDLQVYVRNRIKQLLDDAHRVEKENQKVPECGINLDSTRIPLCSALFEKKYWEKYPSHSEKKSFGKIKNIVIALVNKKYFQLQKEMGDWPSDDIGDFSEPFFTNKCEEIFEHVKEELLAAEENIRNDPRPCRHAVLSLNAYSIRIIERYFTGIIEAPIKYGGKRKSWLLVNEKALSFLRMKLNIPILTMDDLEALAQKPLSSDAKDLLTQIKRIPGYRDTYFKIKFYHYTRKDELFRSQTIEDRDRLLQEIMNQRLSLGYKRVMPKPKYDRPAYEDSRNASHTVRANGSVLRLYQIIK